METGIGSGIFSDDLNIFVSLRLPNVYTFFQAKIYAINLYAKIISLFSFLYKSTSSWVDMSSRTSRQKGK